LTKEITSQRMLLTCWREGGVNIRPEVIPFVLGSLAFGLVLTLSLSGFGMNLPRSAGWGLGVAIILIGYLLFFFRDPDRTCPGDPSLVLAGADGVVAGIAEVKEEDFLKTETVRISIFLTLFDVHVNRAPISGKSSFLGYFPGKRLFTFREKSSELNQHNSIVIEGRTTRCLVKQLVGPVCRRVVYWLDHGEVVDVKMGDRIGMMKFGSRLDMYFPKDDITVLVKKGDRVTAGETVVAKLRGEQ